MKHKGFTLIELMIALAISVFLLMALSDAFFSVKKAVDEREKMMSVEAKALQVITYLNQELPYAGFVGCFNVARDNPVINHLAIKDIALTTSSVLSQDPQVLSATLAEHLVLFSESMKNKTDILVSDPGDLQKQDKVVVSDCSGAEIDSIESIRKVINKAVYKIVLSRPLSRLYQPYASIAVLRRYRYFLRSVNQKRQSSVLFVEDEQGRSHELVEDVYDLNFHYLPNIEQPRAVVVSFVVKNSQTDGGSTWKFVIPLLERI